MPGPAAIADATFVIYSFQLEQFHFQGMIRNLFSEILIPSEVKEELLRTSDSQQHARRQRFLENLPVSSGYYKLCTSTDRIVFDEVFKLDNIDRGEAESIAQMRKRGIRFILSDDKGVHNLPLSYRDLRPFNMPAIIGLLDIAGLLTDHKAFVKAVHECRPVSTRILKEGYLAAAKHHGVFVSPAGLDEKSDLKNMGIV